jgi:hypothetical protein
LLINRGFSVVLILLTTVCAVVPLLGAGAPSNPAGPNILEATQYPGSLIGVQYEPWFVPGAAGTWETAEAVPVLGKYNSLDPNVIRKHAEWFEDLGINWLLLDWTNPVLMKPDLFNTYRQLEKEGKHPPKIVLMAFLQNGPLDPHAVQKLNGIIARTKTNFLDKPEFKDLWLYYRGKPLLVILLFYSQSL